jgi:ribokinase
MSQVLVIGSINVDLVVTVPHLPQPGETVLGSRFERHFGGKGANQAVAAARAGARVTMLGAVGRDAHGDESLAALAAEGIDVSRVRRVDEPTGVALITVDPNGENQIAVAPGANRLVAADALELAEPPPGTVLLASLEVPMAAVAAAIGWAHRRQLSVVLNPAPAQLLSAEMLASGLILTPNGGELLAATGAGDPDAALLSLRQRGAGPVLVTMGAAGVLLVDGEHRSEIADRPRVAVDSTGAGDTFSGVLAAWLAQGRPIREAAAAANAAAGLSVTRAGAREGMPTRTEIEAELLR